MVRRDVEEHVNRGFEKAVVEIQNEPLQLDALLPCVDHRSVTGRLEVGPRKRKGAFCGVHETVRETCHE